MEDIVTRLRRAVDNEPFMLGGEHDLLKDALREITTLLGCCDGAAAQDAHVRQEREEHRAEVEKLRADNERLFNEDTKTRHALKGWALVCPDGGDEPTHERVAAVVAEVERLRAALKPFAALSLWPDDIGDEWTVNDIRSGYDWDETENDTKTDDVFIKRGHIRAARKALESKP